MTYTCDKKILGNFVLKPSVFEKFRNQHSSTPTICSFLQEHPFYFEAPLYSHWLLSFTSNKEQNEAFQIKLAYSRDSYEKECAKAYTPAFTKIPYI